MLLYIIIYPFFVYNLYSPEQLSLAIAPITNTLHFQVKPFFTVFKCHNISVSQRVLAATINLLGCAHFKRPALLSIIMHLVHRRASQRKLKAIRFQGLRISTNKILLQKQLSVSTFFYLFIYFFFLIVHSNIFPLEIFYSNPISISKLSRGCRTIL